MPGQRYYGEIGLNSNARAEVGGPNVLIETWNARKISFRGI